MVNNTDDIPIPPDLPPDLVEKINQAVTYQRIAAKLHLAIVDAGIEIEGLSVTFADGVAVLSGTAKRQSDSEQAGQIVTNYPEVYIVSNAITVQS